MPDSKKVAYHRFHTQGLCNEGRDPRPKDFLDGPSENIDLFAQETYASLWAKLFKDTPYASRVPRPGKQRAMHHCQDAELTARQRLKSTRLGS